MQRDVLVRRIFGGGVDTGGDVTARGGTELVGEQVRAEARGERAKALGGLHLEAAQQYATGDQQLLVDQRP